MVLDTKAIFSFVILEKYILDPLSVIVKLAILTPQYSGTYTGINVTVTTPPAAPGMTVLTFIGPGSYTA